MSLTAILITPWRTVHRSLRWLGGMISALLCIAAMLVAIYVGGPHGWRYGLAFYAFGAGYFWMCVMACLLLVAIDARRLRLPAISRTVTACLLAYGTASTALPLAMFVPMGGDAVTIALVAALAASTGLAWALLPRYAMMLLGSLPALAVGARHLTIHIPVPGEPGFPALGIGMLAVLVVANATRWRRLLYAETPAETGMGSAMVMQYRRDGAMSGALNWGPVGGAWSDARRQRDSVTLRGRASDGGYLRLQGVGPRKPVLALRTALGENHAPQSLPGHLRRFARLGLPLLLFVPLMALMQAGGAQGDAGHKLLLGAGINVVGWLGVMGGISLMVAGCQQPRRCWRRGNAELALLALLPGLGDAASLRRNLLRAALGRALALHGLLLAAVLIAAIAMHAGPLALLLVALAQLGCAATVAVTALTTFGGKALPGWGMSALIAAMGSLVFANTCASLFATLARQPWSVGTSAAGALAVAWAAAAVGLIWLGRRGWRGMVLRPHPFLAN